MFDGLEPLRSSLDQPSVQGMAYLLRHQELWPDGFVFFFPSCDMCALGLAKTFWNMNPPDGIVVHFARVLKMPVIDVARIFGMAIDADGNRRQADIRPGYIADLLDEWVSMQP